MLELVLGLLVVSGTAYLVALWLTSRRLREIGAAARAELDRPALPEFSLKALFAVFTFVWSSKAVATNGLKGPVWTARVAFVVGMLCSLVLLLTPLGDFGDESQPPGPRFWVPTDLRVFFSALLYLACFEMLARRLRKVDREKWQRMGEPSLLNLSVAGVLGLLGFVFTPASLRTGDSLLTSLALATLVSFLWLLGLGLFW